MKMARDYMQRDDSILVVGCGVGYEVGWFQEHGFRHITGLDVSPERLEVCASRYGIPTICADMTQTGLPDTNFDHVLTRQSLHHLFYPFHALEELARIARRSVIIISEPARTWFKETYRRLFGHRIISGANIYEYQFPEQDLHRYMAFNGFELVRCRRYLEMPQIPWPVHELASALAPMLRNRFTTIYERM
jgi:ubiquinone/menaquinone biosynthesis C-methylase UbiE